MKVRAHTRRPLLLFVGSLAWASIACVDIAVERTASRETAETLTHGRALKAGEGPRTGMYPVHQSSDFVQGMRWRESAVGAPASGIYLQHKHRDRNTGKWTEFTFEYPTPFEVRYVSTQVRDKLFVLGERDGAPVIERWEFEKASDEPASAPAVRRFELPSESAPGDLHRMAADPDGRFLLFLHGAPRRLSRLDFATRQRSDLSDQLGLPSLEHYDSLARRQHATEGRVWILFNDVDGVRLLLTDADNNGQFESARELTDAQWEAAGFGGAVWTSDFLRDS